MTNLKETPQNNLLVVTGASGGIGRAIAQMGADQGYSLFLQGHRRVDELKQFASEQFIADPTRKIEIVRADLSREKEQDRFVESVLSTLGTTNRLAGWINAAGIDLMALSGSGATFEERLQAIWSLDVVAAVRMSRRIGAWLGKNKPKRKKRENKSPGPTRPLILFFSWDGAFRGRRGETSLLYATAKGAVAAASKSLAQELAPHVRVCTISPGWIKTSWGKDASSKANCHACSESLSRRWGTPEEIAAFVLYLMSSQADFLNGENFIANGGFRLP